MSELLPKPKLFASTRSFVWVVFLLLLLIAFRLFFSWQTYCDFISKPFYYTYATVLLDYPKSDGKRHYRVLKLQSDEGLVFYTTHYRPKDFSHYRLRLQLFPTDQITFWDYLGTFYLKSTIKKELLLPMRFKERLLGQIESQHQDKALASFYTAIFFAQRLETNLREKVALLSLSHLVALSGFHLGILWGVIYGLFLLLYRPLQQAFFPYRYALIDVGIVTILLLFGYLWFVGFPPSLVRSYAMMWVAWVVLLMGIELLSFSFLTLIILLLILFFPLLLPSLSFWFSVAGVFYIYLILAYASHHKSWVVSMLFIPLGLFVLMLPIVHSVFPLLSPYQLLSPILSLIFIPFYPLVIGLHLLGVGGIFDGALTALFALPSPTQESLLEVEYLIGYSLLSLEAIWTKWLFYLLLLTSFGYMVYLFGFVG